MAKYAKGQSGNPKGRPKGIVDQRSALRALLVPHASELVAKVVAKARKGDMVAARICIDRLIPPLKSQDSVAEIPPLVGSVSEQADVVVSALSARTITPGQADAVMSVLAARARIVESFELTERVRVLEEKLALALKGGQ